MDNLSGSIPVLLEYSKALEVHVKWRYLQKISMVGVDPASIPSEEFEPECLPPIEATDLLGYLVLETTYYTKQQFKAFKSLEAYNQMVSGFVTSVRGRIISGKHVVVAEVRHSQRMNDPLVSIWIIAENDGKILSAHNDVEIIKETVGQIDKQGTLANLSDSDYQIILDAIGWLNCDIIQQAQVLLYNVNPSIEGLQRPTLRDNQ